MKRLLKLLMSVGFSFTMILVVFSTNVNAEQWTINDGKEGPAKVGVKLESKKKNDDFSTQHLVYCEGYSYLYTSGSGSYVNGMGWSDCGPNVIEKIAVHTELLKNGNIMKSGSDTQTYSNLAEAYAGQIPHDRWEDYKERSTHFYIHDGTGATAYSEDNWL
ncbi:hypothetical protein JOC86_002209 [Bacillus pakistanensis]|uniref:Uncharacterized protein n=1 Tax=Rossellomorea pakistanensis TaxID=992288 RepID=A0ABS2NCS7_9BACI|nr:hypothetical protein [Bacillus pakistanensis]MBM7585667.1 hypothetical protein [Bacillus pakistanensis]